MLLDLDPFLDLGLDHFLVELKLLNVLALVDRALQVFDFCLQGLVFFKDLVGAGL